MGKVTEINCHFVISCTTGNLIVHRTGKWGREEGAMPALVQFPNFLGPSDNSIYSVVIGIFK